MRVTLQFESRSQIKIIFIVLLLIITVPVMAGHNSNRISKGLKSSKSVEKPSEPVKKAKKKATAKKNKPTPKMSSAELEEKRRRELSIKLLERIGQSPTKSDSGASNKVKPMTLSEAEELALLNDPLIARIKSLQEGMEQKAQAAYSWPDPKLKFGVMNLPQTSLDFEQEAMTQVVVGLVQKFPPFGAVTAKRDQFMALSDGRNYQYQNRELETLRNIRLTWLKVHKFYQIRKLVQESLEIFTQLKKITRLQYRAGRGKQQDVIRSQLEESLLLDRKVVVITNYEKAIAELRKALNITLFKRNLEMVYPRLHTPPPELQIRQHLDRHPWVMVGETHIKAAKNGVQYANAQFFPGWSLDLSFGQRGANPDTGVDREDMMSAMIMVDLPVFWGGRQSRQLQSSQSMLSAAKYQLDDRNREMRRRLEASLATYSRASERLELYHSQLLPQAEQNTESSLSAYQSGVNTFSVLVRARLTEMDSRIQLVKLIVDKGFAKVELLYLAGVK